MRIFAEGDLSRVLSAQLSALHKEIREENKNKLLNMNEAAYIEYLISKYSVEPIEFIWDEMTISEREQMIPARSFPGDFHVINGKSYPKQILTYHLPFNGEKPLLELTPSTRILWTTEVDVAESEISFEIINWRNNADEIKREADSILSKMESQSRNVKKQVDSWNSTLPTEALQIVRARKQELLNQSDLLEQLGVPLRKSDSVSPTFAVPVEKQKPIVRKPEASTEPFVPEPVLDADIFNSILQICHDMGREMERHPSVYHGKEEETLRDHFIMQLSPHFQSVGGETFNKEGKTDILIRHDGGNVFVAECKYWSGIKGFFNAVDQLLSYLTWRDSKASLLIFVKNKDFGAVLEQIRSKIADHDSFDNFLGEPKEAWFNFRFHLPSDESRSISLSVLVFHFPE
jgi:hypothetical protein